MDNDRRKIELMNSILLSMPGTPIIYYGDEIGMGDNIYLGDRNGVRTPMQWTPDRNGGFSRADPAQLYLPPIMDPVYGFDAVNVEAQTRSLSSLLNWMKRLISVRKSTKVFGRGTLTFIRPGEPRGARLCAPARRRGHPLRRQHLALGAGRRARHERMEGPHAAGDAGPHAFPAHRRPALSGDAAALWLLLVPAATPTRRASRQKVAATRHHDAGDRRTAGKMRCRAGPGAPSRRGAAELHAGTALVRRQGFAVDLAPRSRPPCRWRRRRPLHLRDGGFARAGTA